MKTVFTARYAAPDYKDFGVEDFDEPADSDGCDFPNLVRDFEGSFVFAAGAVEYQLRGESSEFVAQLKVHRVVVITFKA